MSEPPPASSWAAPPEFYADENLAGRTLVQALRRLGYVVHTPPELFGSRTAAEGVNDEDWLPVVGSHGWAVISKDDKIRTTAHEFAALRAARVHTFFFPNQATRDQLTEIIAALLGEMCTATSARAPTLWQVRRRDGRWVLDELPLQTKRRPPRSRRRS